MQRNTFSICREQCLDYGQIDSIVRLNGIEDKGKIYAGQIILLPQE